MHATSLLTGHHRSVAELLEKLALEKKDHGVDVQRLAKCLLAHTVIEREAFYPAVAEIDPDIVHESQEEHALAEGELERLLATDSCDPAFRARLIALKEAIECHMEEEEQNLFPMIEQEWDERELMELGKAMSVRFEQIRKCSLPSMLARNAIRKPSDGSSTTESGTPVLRRNFHWRARPDHPVLSRSR